MTAVVCQSPAATAAASSRPAAVRPPLAVVIPALLVAGCGCGGPLLIEVEGLVRWQGRPVPAGVVTFVPADESAGMRPAAGRIDAAGRYRMAALPGRPGVLPGRYRVALRAATGSPDEGGVTWLVPDRFADPATSGLSVDVPAAGPALTHDIDLEE